MTVTSFTLEPMEGLQGGELWQRRCIAVGALTLIRATSRLGVPTLSYLQDTVDLAFRHGQLGIWTNQVRRPVGYAIWACLSDKTLSELAGDLSITLHVSEWREGPNVCILDAAALPGYGPALIQQLGILFRDESQVVYVKHKPSVRVLNAVDREGASRLLRRLQNAERVR
jgi:hemolysin-activating ACP:hemolysin acyltransferase